MKTIVLLALVTFFPFVSYAQDKDEVIADLKAELAVSQAETKEYQATLDAFTQKMKALMGPLTLDEIPGYLTKLTKEFSQLKVQVEVLTAEKDHIEQIKERIFREKKDTDAALSKLAKETGKALGRKDAVELERVPAIIAELRHDNNELRDQTKRMEVEIEELQAELKKLKAK